MRVVIVLCKATRFFFKMIWISASTFIIIAGYILLILYFLKGWNRLPEINTKHRSRRSVFISVVIPFRNEESNLMKLVEDIGRQRFSFHHLEVVMVDDHSADNGVELLHELQIKCNWLRVESSPAHGKKAALRHGVSAATGELIVATDADCHFGRDWLQTISETYINQNPDMIIMPVGMEQGTGLLGAFQQNDYLALQMVTAGAAGCRVPVIGSGANLAFKKKSYLETARKIPGAKYLSGDDVFLLHAFKAEGFKITYLKSAQAMVKTHPASGWKHFLLQRMRWGGKSKGYTDIRAKLVALMILVTNSWLTVLPFFAVSDFRVLFLWLGAMAMKIIVDRMLINQGKDFFAVSSGTFRFLAFSFLYPPYIFVAGIGSLFIRERWKDRTGK
ncbi:glycosyltransferase [Marinilabilia salmonicolor]|uniref:glycosyltransferase n=1 Tax=Marinilabilia salmonicolor TaxID=989 RepID=UPI00029A8781|nr:glycosyltransferase [Marinilabilia salmonicolor]